jgi:hypothetical protein
MAREARPRCWVVEQGALATRQIRRAAKVAKLSFPCPPSVTTGEPVRLRKTPEFKRMGDVTGRVLTIVLDQDVGKSASTVEIFRNGQ